ncbi:hypothetical protein HHK36_016362 [Tetracentron sinense]|uniref:HTH myb-type domain-containing protein n=1 Tax=Tetracentron sinense TaxID=13715 RepID=A0A834YZI1_TETSI|nr:hypothetical protein HHK36_016362 [Tetracentron sinense]
MSDYEGHVRDGDEERVFEWELGLPSADDLTPLSQPLISPELASAFNISPERCRSMIDVNRASHNTLSSLRIQTEPFSSNNFKSLPSFTRDPLVVQGDDELDPENSTEEGLGSRKVRRIESTEEADSALRTENSSYDHSARTLKRPRLVWTPQLHKRFVDVVAHLGIKNVVPKTIMQLMNVDGLTRENVASHLQKYRLYLKRMQDLSNNDAPSSSDLLFASTPVPPSLQESSGHGHGNGHMPLPMPAPPVMHMPIVGVAHGHGNVGVAAYNGFESHPYSMFRDQQQDWSINKFGAIVSYPHVTPNDN